MRLAVGTARCKRTVGHKGIPVVLVESDKDTKQVDEIPLFPVGWGVWKGCKFGWSDPASPTFETPRGRSLPVYLWDGIPFISKEDARKLWEDLPDENCAGRRFGLVRLAVAEHVVAQEDENRRIPRFRL